MRDAARQMGGGTLRAQEKGKINVSITAENAQFTQCDRRKKTSVVTFVIAVKTTYCVTSSF